MKFKHEFRGRNNNFPSACNVYVHSDDDYHYILFENTDEGVSVTNASEQLATEIVELLKLDPDDCRFFEKYSHNLCVDEITYLWRENEFNDSKWKAIDPQWKYTPDEKINKLWDK